MGKNPILFLPTHRSYADFCLMTYLCFHYDIELPAVAAGMGMYIITCKKMCIEFYLKNVSNCFSSFNVKNYSQNL